MAMILIECGVEWSEKTSFSEPHQVFGIARYVIPVGRDELIVAFQNLLEHRLVAPFIEERLKTTQPAKHKKF